MYGLFSYQLLLQSFVIFFIIKKKRDTPQLRNLYLILWL